MRELISNTRIPTSYGLKNHLPKEVIKLCKKISKYKQAYLYGRCLADILYFCQEPTEYHIISEIDHDILLQLMDPETIQEQNKDYILININNVRILVTGISIKQRGTYPYLHLITYENLLSSTIFYCDAMLYDIERNALITLDDGVLFDKQTDILYFASSFLEKPNNFEKNTGYIIEYMKILRDMNTGNRKIDFRKYASYGYFLRDLLFYDSKNSYYGSRSAFDKKNKLYSIYFSNVISSLSSHSQLSLNDILYKNDITDFLSPKIAERSYCKNTRFNQIQPQIRGDIISLLKRYLTFIFPTFNLIFESQKFDSTGFLSYIGFLLFGLEDVDETIQPSIQYLSGENGAAIIIAALYLSIGYSLTSQTNRNVSAVTSAFEIFISSRSKDFLTESLTTKVIDLLYFYNTNAYIFDKLLLGSGHSSLAYIKNDGSIKPSKDSYLDDQRDTLTSICPLIHKEFHDDYQTVLAPFFLIGMQDFLSKDFCNKLKETYDALYKTDSTDDAIKQAISKFKLESRVYLNPNFYMDVVVPILKNKLKNNMISDDIDSILSEIQSILSNV